MYLGTEDEVLTITGCVPGAVPPFGSAFEIATFMDESLRLQGPIINFNAGLRTDSFSMSVDDYIGVEAPFICDIASR